MPVRQGGKFYAQVLLDLNRYKLLEKMAAELDTKVTALIRRFVYQALEERLHPSTYRAAERADAALWAASVQRRVEGRRRNRGVDPASVPAKPAPKRSKRARLTKRDARLLE